VNSLGLTEQQPENNVQRIVLEMLGVTLSADARARADPAAGVERSAGLPRPWDQQWSLRIQQVLAFESDLLEYPDIFAGSIVMEAKVHELTVAAQGELDDVLALGGAFARSTNSRVAGRQPVRTRRAHRVGRADRRGREPLHRDRRVPLTSDESLEAIVTVDPAVEKQMIDDVRAWRANRDEVPWTRPSKSSSASRAAATADNIMVPTIALAKAGGTTGEWAGALRDVFGEYRAPTGVRGGVGSAARLRHSSRARR
jgi:(2R)-ethylmalonyl-CoA mutase